MENQKIEFKIICGIYFLYDNENLCYIGQSKDVIYRVCTHAKTKTFSHYTYIECLESELDQIEFQYIQKFSPILNKTLNPKKKEYLVNKPFLFVFNIESRNRRKYYNIFDIKKRFPHLSIEKLDLLFNNQIEKNHIKDNIVIVH